MEISKTLWALLVVKFRSTAPYGVYTCVAHASVGPAREHRLAAAGGTDFAPDSGGTDFVPDFVPDFAPDGGA